MIKELDCSFASLQSPSRSTCKMTAFWRAAGLTYVGYSSIAARVTRQALKPALKVDKDLWIYISDKFIILVMLAFSHRTVTNM